MVPENNKAGKISPCFEKYSLPMLNEPRTVRVKFCKTGSMQFISLLDLQRTVQKIFIRAGIPMWYTKGFNPHPKIIFAAPLPVGTESLCEYIDVRIEREISCEQILERINKQMTEEFHAIDVYEPTSKLNDIAWSEYEYVIYCDGEAEKKSEQIKSLFNTETLMMTKHTKSGEKEFNIIPLIKSIETFVCVQNNTIKIKAVLSVASESYLNPELLVTAIKNDTDVFVSEQDLPMYSIMRKKLFFADFVNEFK